MPDTELHPLRLKKSERLRLKTLVNSLFQNGQSLYSWPLRLVYHRFSQEELDALFRYGTPNHIGPLQLLVTVPKKKRKKAVDRVLLRRRIREAYRKNRLEIKELVAADEKCVTLSLAFIYLSDKNEDFETINANMIKLLSKLKASL